jgi:hypothetical protein
MRTRQTNLTEHTIVRHEILHSNRLRLRRQMHDLFVAIGSALRHRRLRRLKGEERVKSSGRPLVRMGPIHARLARRREARVSKEAAHNEAEDPSKMTNGENANFGGLLDAFVGVAHRNAKEKSESGIGAKNRMSNTHGQELARLSPLTG